MGDLENRLRLVEIKESLLNSLIDRVLGLLVVQQDPNVQDALSSVYHEYVTQFNLATDDYNLRKNS